MNLGLPGQLDEEKPMGDSTRREILREWSCFDPYVQRVLSNRFVDMCGKGASREVWLEFLYRERETSNDYPH